MLLVDGDEARAVRLARRLAGLECQIAFAANGAEALLRVHETLPDLVVTAAEMPVLDGVRMLDALRSQSRTRQIPVILLTEGNTPEELTRGWEAGADLCIPRCQGEADVVATLHRALPVLLQQKPEDSPPREARPSQEEAFYLPAT